jgi:hypothetical protein
MEDKVAVISVLYDYPNHFTPTFEKRILKDINKEDYFVIRYFSEEEGIKDRSYYFKFTYYRIFKIVEFIKKNILGKYGYFILLDATDVGYVGGIENIVSIMKKYDTDILFGSEKNLWPVTNYSHLHSTKNVPSDFKFLNAGVFCANPETYLKHLEMIKERNLVELCDQGNWQIEYLLTDEINIDYDNLLVLNTYLAKDSFEIVNNEILFNINKPIFVHDNGGYNDQTIKLLNFY